jgi:hypothetical protein
MEEGFALTPVSADRFWSPNPPVLLISKISVNNAYGSDGQYSEDGLLNVRDTLISELTISEDVNVTKKEYILNANEIIGQIPAAPQCLEETGSLVGEAALLSHSFASLFAKRALGGTEVSEKELHKLTMLITSLQTINIAKSAEEGDSDILTEEEAKKYGFNGPLPEKTAVEYHKQPWYPLFMEWKADYYPDSDLIQDIPKINSWRRMGLDMTYKTKGSKTSMKLIDAVSISGRTFLSPHAGESLDERLKDLDTNIPNARSISVLSQSLPELHEQLMMRSLQLMPTVYCDDKNGMKDLLTALDGYDPVFPLFNSLFSPVRAGFLRIRSIILIDSFGQFIEANPKWYAASESLRGGDEVSVAEVMLPPRLLQPSRVNFSLRGETENNAVCSWILPNLFDNNITFFSAEGTLLGTLQLVKEGENNLLKFKLPPEQGGKAVPVDKIEADKDLKNFLTGLMKNGASAFSALMESIDEALTATNPPAAAQFNSLSFFLGRPLALVRTAVSIETLGPRRAYRCFEGTTPPYPDVNVSELEVNLRMGFRHRQDDGLLGFFDNDNFDFIHFCGHTGEVSHEYIRRGRGADFVKVKINDEPRNLVLLMDPVANVHVTSGILPVKTLKINPSYVQAAMRALYHLIFVAPVIQDEQALSLPIFPVEEKRWAWSGFNMERVFESDKAPNKSTPEAFFSGFNAFLREGWLTLKNKNDEPEETEENSIV